MTDPKHEYDEDPEVTATDAEAEQIAGALREANGQIRDLFEALQHTDEAEIREQQLSELGQLWAQQALLLQRRAFFAGRAYDRNQEEGHLLDTAMAFQDWLNRMMLEELQNLIEDTGAEPPAPSEDALKIVPSAEGDDEVVVVIKEDEDDNYMN